MTNFAENYEIDSLLSKENTSFDYQKADFNSVWGSLTPGSISEEERLLFEQPTTTNKEAHD